MQSTLDLWYQALASEHGIVIESNDVDRTIQRLYRDRDKSGDESLKSIKIKRSPTVESQIWLLKQ